MGYISSICAHLLRVSTMDNTRFANSPAPRKEVARVQFGILNPKSIRGLSVVKVTNHQTYEKGKPKMDGLSDARMGTVDRTFCCETCGCDVQNCPGHPGHIDLVSPVYHIGFLQILVKVLRCISFYCSKLVCSQNDFKFKHALRLRSAEARFKAIAALCDKDKVICPYTDRLQPKFKVENGGITVDFSKASQDGQLSEGKQVLSPAKAHEVLKRVSDSDYELMGFPVAYVRPDWMVLTVLPVPPPCVRPSIMGNSSRSDDDLTTKLADIIKANNKLKLNMENGNTEIVLNEFHKLLQYNVTTYFDNSRPGIAVATQRSGRPIKSITERLGGKEVSVAC